MKIENPILELKKLRGYRKKCGNDDVVSHNYVNGSIACEQFFFKERDRSQFRICDSAKVLTMKYQENIGTHNEISGKLQNNTCSSREREHRPTRISNDNGTFEIYYNDSESLETHVFIAGDLKGQIRIFRSGEARPFRGSDRLGRDFEIYYYDDENLITHLYSSEQLQGLSFSYRPGESRPFSGTDRLGRHFEIIYDENGVPSNKNMKNLEAGLRKV